MEGNQGGLAPNQMMPSNVIVVLLDSLNRHLLGAYGAREFDTPNLDRFAKRALRFERHFVGSVPTMPARHDILCGALNFLWKPWGSIEVWEDAITYQLRDAGVTTMLVTDNPHLFETGGENYHTDFSAWEYLRGHENDPWRTVPDPTWAGTPALPARSAKRRRHYDDSRTWFRSEEDFPGPKTMAAAASWLETNAGVHDRFLLFVDEFDPHEPFDTPEPYASLYDPEWEGEHVIWPPYAVGGVRNGVLSEREARQVRANYGAKLTMIDHWFGRVLDVVDRKGMWDDTAVVVCSDHGHYLGERDLWGKPAVPLFEPLGHIPFLVAWPGRPAGSVCALTTSVDIHATLLEVFGVAAAHRTHGRSLVPLLRVRDGSASPPQRDRADRRERRRGGSRPHRQRAVGVGRPAGHSGTGARGGDEEATLGSYWAVDVIAECGGRLHLAHPLGIMAFAIPASQKDHSDAFLAADLLRLDRLPEAWVAPPEISELCELVRDRHKLVEAPAKAKVQVQAVFAKEGFALPMSDLFGIGSIALLEKANLDEVYPIRVESLRDLIDSHGWRSPCSIDRALTALS